MDHIIDELATIGDKFSDCTILLSGEESFRTHRLVLHLHSPVLAGLLDLESPIGESGSVTLDLKHEDSTALHAMLHFFYHGAYDAPDQASALEFHVAVHQIAEKYETSALQALAYSSFRNILLEESWNAQDLVDAATKLEEVNAVTQNAECMRKDIIQAISKHSYDLFDSSAFKNFIQEYPAWIIRLLKVYETDRLTSRRDDGEAVNEGSFDEDHENQRDGESGGCGEESEFGGGDGDHQCEVNADWETTHGPGAIIGPSNRPDPSNVYTRGAPKPMSKGFKARAAAAAQLNQIW